MSKHKKKMTAKEFDRRFDAGEDVTACLDLSRATRPGHVKRRVNVDFPNWMHPPARSGGGTAWHCTAGAYQTLAGRPPEG